METIETDEMGNPSQISYQLVIPATERSEAGVTSPPSQQEMSSDTVADSSVREGDKELSREFLYTLELETYTDMGGQTKTMMLTVLNVLSLSFKCNKCYLPFHRQTLTHDQMDFLRVHACSQSESTVNYSPPETSKELMTTAPEHTDARLKPIDTGTLLEPICTGTLLEPVHTRTLLEPMHTGTTLETDCHRSTIGSTSSGINDISAPTKNTDGKTPQFLSDPNVLDILRVNSPSLLSMNMSNSAEDVERDSRNVVANNASTSGQDTPQFISKGNVANKHNLKSEESSFSTDKQQQPKVDSEERENFSVDMSEELALLIEVGQSVSKSRQHKKSPAKKFGEIRSAVEVKGVEENAVIHVTRKVTRKKLASIAQKAERCIDHKPTRNSKRLRSQQSRPLKNTRSNIKPATLKRSTTRVAKTGRKLIIRDDSASDVEQGDSEEEYSPKRESQKRRKGCKTKEIKEEREKRSKGTQYNDSDDIDVPIKSEGEDSAVCDPIAEYRGEMEGRKTRKRRQKTEEKEIPQCHICGRVFREKRGLVQHTMSHSEEKPHECSVCGKTFKRKSTLKDHMLTHGGEKRFLCDTCGKKFLRKSDYTAHIRTHTNELSCKCPECGKSCKGRVHLELHRRKHTKDRPYLCTTCGETFKYPLSLHSHMRVHKVAENPLQCSECDNVYDDVDDLRLHECAKGKKHLCSVCGKLFTQPAGLQTHMKKHMRDKPSSCQYCHVTFPNELCLQNHKDNNMILCSGCGKNIKAARSCMMDKFPAGDLEGKTFLCWACHCNQADHCSALSQEIE